MRDITVLVTASGAPGTAALLRALRLNGERGVRIVGIDMSPQAIGRHFCDRFYVVPPGTDPAFADAVLDVPLPVALGLTAAFPLVMLFLGFYLPAERRQLRRLLPILGR